MKKIPLSDKLEKFALVDDEDFEYLSQWKWYFSKNGYAARKQRIGLRKFNKQKLIYMHRLINKTPEGFQTDHINRDKLDNRKENLRIATSSQNAINTNLYKNNTSGYRGIYWDKIRNKWQVSIKANQKKIHLGYYSNIQGAWLARRWGERVYWQTGANSV